MDQTRNTSGTSSNETNPAGMVPAAGKHAARPSQAERHQTLHEYPQTDAGALRQEGLEPQPDDYDEKG